MPISATSKYQILCDGCGNRIASFREWFTAGQICPQCGGELAHVEYSTNLERLREAFQDSSARRDMWRYFDFLPVNDPRNIVSLFEGEVTIHRWPWLEQLAAERYGIDCHVWAHRQDRNYATGTFKDLAGSVVASVLKEQGVQDYVVASTGNIGVAFSRYLKEAGITLYAFIPENSPKVQEAEIAVFGQRVFRVKGDYAQTKELAAEFARKHGFLSAGGSADPMRVEAKKTMAFEWLRATPEFPTVYLQALSGGTGPLGVTRALDALDGKGFFDQRPRLLLVQSDRCAPMAQGWAEAEAAGFPEGWEQNYPVIESPDTGIATLSTGRPTAFPLLARRVRESGGAIIDFPEERVKEIAMLAGYEMAARLGPAAAITVGGFMRALSRGLIRDGDRAMINIGEGIRRAPFFIEQYVNGNHAVATVEDCAPRDSERYRRELWASVESLLQVDL